jgi:hypothetical protein
MLEIEGLTNWTLSPGNLNQLDWTINLLTGIENYSCNFEIGEFGEAENIFPLNVPFKVTEISFVAESDSAQVHQDSGVDILGHCLEVVEVSALILDENFVVLASTLLGEVEDVDLRIDEDARSHVVRIVQEGVMLESFCTGLKATVSLRSYTRMLSHTLLSKNKINANFTGAGKAYLTANVQQDWSRGRRNGMVYLLAVLKLDNALVRYIQLPDL